MKLPIVVVHTFLVLDDLKFLAGICQLVDGLQRLSNSSLLLLQRVEPGVWALLHLQSQHTYYWIIGRDSRSRNSRF